MVHLFRGRVTLYYVCNLNAMSVKSYAYFFITLISYPEPWEISIAFNTTTTMWKGRYRAMNKNQINCKVKDQLVDIFVTNLD